MRQRNLVDVHVGARVRRTRLFRGIAAKTFAAALNLSVRSLARLERGETGFSAGQLVDAARLLKVELGFFCTGMEALQEVVKGPAPASNVVAFPTTRQRTVIPQFATSCVVLAFPARRDTFQISVDGIA